MTEVHEGKWNYLMLDHQPAGWMRNSKIDYMLNKTKKSLEKVQKNQFTSKKMLVYSVTFGENLVGRMSSAFLMSKANTELATKFQKDVTLGVKSRKYISKLKKILTKNVIKESKVVLCIHPVFSRCLQKLRPGIELSDLINGAKGRVAGGAGVIFITNKNPQVAMYGGFTPIVECIQYCGKSQTNNSSLSPSFGWHEKYPKFDFFV